MILRSVLHGQNAEAYYFQMGYLWLIEKSIYTYQHIRDPTAVQPIGWSYYSMHIKVHPKVCGKIQASNNRMSYDGVLWWANSDNSLELAFILLNAAFSMFMIVAHMMALCCCSSLLLLLVSSCRLHF